MMSLRGKTGRMRAAYPPVLASAHDDGARRGECAQEGTGVSDYLDPTDSVAVPRQTATRPVSLDGKVITLLDISKAKGEHLLDRLEELLREARPAQGDRAPQEAHVRAAGTRSPPGRRSSAPRTC